MDIELLQKQMEFLTSNEEELALCTGLGYGKTTAGSLFAINESINNNAPGLIVASTYGQLRSATLSNLKLWCQKLKIRYNYNTSTKMVLIHQTEHFVRSAEAAEQTRGIEAGWLWGDEAAYINQEAMDVFLGRIRHPRGSLKKRFTTTPNGYNDFYHYWHPSGDKYDPSRRLITAKTSDNHFLPKAYLESLRRSYTPKLALQELDGEFISLRGLACYYEFDRNKHVMPVKHFFKNLPSQQLYIFMDINIDPLAGVVVFFENGKLFVIDEIYIEGGTDLRTLAVELKNKFGKYDPIIVFDGTGGNKRNIFNIKETANKLIQEYGLRTENMFNPLVVKRLANVNLQLHKGNLLIDSSCKNLIRDLEQVQYGKDSNDIDKTNKLLSHVSDGLGYAVWRLFPKENKGSKTILF